MVNNSTTLHYLGVTLDGKLTWEPHIRYISGRAALALNALRALAKVSYGANPGTLMIVYKGLIRAILEWASILYASARQSLLVILDRVQYAAIRIILGFMRSTPIPILLSEAGEPPLTYRRSLLLNRNAVRLVSWNDNPVLPRLLKLRMLSEKRRGIPKYVAGFPLLQSLDSALELQGGTKKPSRPSNFDVSWSDLVFDLDLMLDSEMGGEIGLADSPDILLNCRLSSRFPMSTVFYTDGSYKKSTGRAGSGVFAPAINFKQGTKLISCNSAYMAELQAVYRTLRYVEDLKIRKAVICTDALNIINDLKSRINGRELVPIVYGIAVISIKLLKAGYELNFVWIPSHRNISGNVEADKQAKTARDFDIGKFTGFSAADNRTIVDEDFKATTKHLWPFFPEARVKQKYFNYVSAKSERPWFHNLDLPRKTICLINRLRSGHVCTGELFQRFGWNIPYLCKCGYETSSLQHYLYDCALFNES